MMPPHLEMDVDFAVLALQFPQFNKCLKSNGQLDFSDPKSVQQLTQCLLKRDFGLEVDLPDDRLCPPVPNRRIYLQWIQALLDSTDIDSYLDESKRKTDIIGLDIGTGASCIYPLLGCSMRPEWRFAATDVDDKNLTYAKRNILKNKLKHRIRPLLTTMTDSLIPLDALGLDILDFTMCNPPFYASNVEMLASAASKSRPPHSACTGAEVEMVTPGGEVAFVSRMIKESWPLKDRCRWFTSMLGKYGSVETIVERLKGSGITNWAVTDLVQGNKTRRWAVAWSWAAVRPSQDVARGTSTLPKHLLPFPCEFGFILIQTMTDCGVHLQKILSSLPIRWQYRSDLAAGVVFASENVWSRAARRSKQSAAPDADGDSALGFKIQIRDTTQAVEISVRWLQGNDSVVFESFCGMLRRQMTNG